MITMGFPAFPLLILILLPFTTSQSYGNITYNRLGIVESIHQLPRYDQNFHRSSNTFNIDTNDLHNEYTESVIVVPILLTCLIFVAFTLFELALCCRYCCACCSCIQHRPDRESIGSMAIWTEKVTNSKVSLIRGFWILVFLSLIACQGDIPAAIFLMAGSQKGINSVDNLYDVAVELKNSGEYLENSGDTILDLTASAIPSCPEASYVQTYADDFETYVTDYQDIINPIPNDLNTLEDFIHAYAVKVVTISIWSTYAVVLVTLLVIVLSYRSRSRILVKVSIGWGTIVLHTLLVVWCLSMIAMVFPLIISLFVTLFLDCDG